MNDNLKLSVKNVTNITSEWGDQFCSLTAWHNNEGVDVTFSNIPTISLDNNQVHNLLAVLSNFINVNNMENLDLEKKN